MDHGYPDDVVLAETKIRIREDTYHRLHGVALVTGEQIGPIVTAALRNYFDHHPDTH